MTRQDDLAAHLAALIADQEQEIWCVYAAFRDGCKVFQYVDPHGLRNCWELQQRSHGACFGGPDTFGHRFYFFLT